MLRQKFYLGSCDWDVNIYYVVTKPHAEEILEHLVHIGCGREDIQRAYVNLTSGNLDSGLTYSNSSIRESVVVIAKTSSALEFGQSWTHELGHLSTHIAQTCGLNLAGEGVRYINDELIAQTWDIARELLCEHCRKH